VFLVGVVGYEPAARTIGGCVTQSALLILIFKVSLIAGLVGIVAWIAIWSAIARWWEMRSVGVSCSRRA
jgi:hypothetical protein